MRDFRALMLAGLFACPSFGAHAAEPVCEIRRFEISRFTVCMFDSRRDELRLAWTGLDGGALRSFERLKTALGRDAARVRFAMNAGMYAENGNPIGLYVENGKVRRPLNERDGTGNFYMKPNGVFSLDTDGTVHIEPSDAFATRHARPSFASQSGPVLVTNNVLHPGISENGPSQYIRNGVGIRDAHTAMFVISDDPVSFGKLARFLRDGLKCRDALYFDGAISSAWIPTQHRMAQAAPLGPIVVVMGKR